MAILTGAEIQWQIKFGNIVIDPFDEKRLNPNSYNLTLDKRLLVYETNEYMFTAHCGEKPGSFVEKTWPSPFAARLQGAELGVDAYGNEINDCILDMSKEPKTRELEIGPKGLVLLPGVLYLGATVEHTETRHFAPFIEGRSSVGRLGCSIHHCAGFGDNGFKGTFTLEITVVQPLRVFANVEVCQIAYSTLQGAETYYQGKYNGQGGPKASGLWKDFLNK